ncbi:MAG: PorT family protein [Muribaculaceae bacterium]|nr:PorT family protein [Muribaculaceae bacterium]
MKKITIALVFMLLTAGAAMAQKQFTFGPKIGVDYTHFWGKNAYHGGQLNYQAGLFMEYRFTSSFSIAPEVVFAAQGGKYEVKDYNDGDGYFDAKFTDNINYINIPVMFKYYVTPALSIDLGPQLGINVYSKYTVESKDKHLNIKETIDQKDDTKAIDVGVGLGLTYNITNDVFVQGRYTLGLTEVFDKSWDTGKNGNAQIAIGYRF